MIGPAILDDQGEASVESPIRIRGIDASHIAFGIASEVVPDGSVTVSHAGMCRATDIAPAGIGGPPGAFRRAR